MDVSSNVATAAVGSHAVACPHLMGRITHGDSIDDEWFLVALLMQLTKSRPDIAITVRDSDGQFLLIEVQFLLIEVQFLLIEVQFLLVEVQFLLIEVQFLLVEVQFLLVEVQFLLIEVQFLLIEVTG